MVALGCVTDRRVLLQHERPISPGSKRAKVELNALLTEHIISAAAATRAALNGRTAAFQATAWALDTNWVVMGNVFSAVSGPKAQQAFLPLWRQHIGFVVDDTRALTTKDKAKQQKPWQIWCSIAKISALS